MDLTLEQEKESQKTQYQMLEAQNFFTLVDHVIFYSLFLFNLHGYHDFHCERLLQTVQGLNGARFPLFRLSIR